MTYYVKHAFFCTNQRDNGKKCCQQAGASEMVEYAKQQIKDLALNANKTVRINKAGCMGRCAEGPSIVIYPEGIWYTYANQQDIDEIIQSHLVNDKIVHRLLMKERESEMK